MQKKIISCFILVIAIALMLCVWPIGLIMGETGAKASACDYYESGPIQDDIKYEQEFIPQHSYLESISIQISRDGTFQHGDEGSVIFSLYDDKGGLVSSTEERVLKIVSKNYQTFPINQRVRKGSTYRISIEGIGCESAGPSVRYGEKVRIGLEENQKLFYDEAVITGYSTVAIYQYRSPLRWMDVLAYDAWIVTIAGLCYTCITQFKRKRQDSVLIVH